MKTLFVTIISLIFFIPSLFATQDTVSITLQPSKPGIQIPSDFAGLSFETSNLTIGTFKPSKDTLIRLLNTLNLKSLRIGGNSVDKDTFNTISSKYHITTSEIDSFYLCIQKTPAKVLMGVMLGGDNNPSLIAKQTSYIEKKYSNLLKGWEIGNEPDLYHSNGFRTSSYNVTSYINEWLPYYDTIKKYSPSAVFTGPVSAYNYTGFTLPFAREEGSKISLLTQHYYVAAANSAPVRKQVATLLNPTTMNSIVDEVKTIVQCADSNKISFRMSECNSFYNGGQWGVSDAQASALWALDYMYSLASAGCVGVNFHGGLSGPYTSFAYTNKRYVARPLFYAILAFQVGGNGKIIPQTITNSSKINLTSYSTIDSSTSIFTTLINKDTLAEAIVELNFGSLNYVHAEFTQLAADSLTDTLNTTWGGQKVSAYGTIASPNWTSLTVSNGKTLVHIPLNSALVVRAYKSTTGVYPLEATNGFNPQIYPNPSRGNLTIDLGQLISPFVKLEITDINGSVLNATILNNQKNALSFTELQPGVYFLRLSDINSGEVRTMKVVYQP